MIIILFIINCYINNYNINFVGTLLTSFTIIYSSLTYIYSGDKKYFVFIIIAFIITLMYQLIRPEYAHQAEWNLECNEKLFYRKSNYV